ncbi:hypothetical protein C1S70_22210 (plasmid) [Azospirillum argentinense]|uniref:Uncharacterized protein n=1 Tax=Azospirillum argentinense TaxID=2970906 RepID=A0A2K1FVQ9_9PROT|nr:hypothetical protein C1S70_22210 [Azospirillum argentinense]
MGGSGAARDAAPVMPRMSEYINISVPNARTLCVPPTILSARRAIQEGDWSRGPVRGGANRERRSRRPAGGSRW